MKWPCVCAPEKKLMCQCYLALAAVVTERRKAGEPVLYFADRHEIRTKEKGTAEAKLGPGPK